MATTDLTTATAEQLQPYESADHEQEAWGMTGSTWAVYSRFQGVVRVHYSHLTEQQAEGEADRMNGHLLAMGRVASWWAEEHHPEQVFVIN